MDFEHKSLLGASAPGFDEPLAMLRACHERIGAQCHTLEKLAAHLAQFGGDEQARQAARGILRYFDTAAKHHHADEEQDLFPQLLASANDETRILIAGFLADHAALESAWRKLRAPLVKIGQGDGEVLSASDVADFNARYATHIQLENSQLLPLAECMLSAEQQERLGRRMAERRGARF